jgi:hypothetical protein
LQVPVKLPEQNVLALFPLFCLYCIFIQAILREPDLFEFFFKRPVFLVNLFLRVFQITAFKGGRMVQSSAQRAGCAFLQRDGVLRQPGLNEKVFPIVPEPFLFLTDCFRSFIQKGHGT